MGWLVVMFDLPVGTASERRTANCFRRQLKRSGYVMIQYSVYARPCVTQDRREKHTEKLKSFLPSGGNVRVTFMTDTQWKNTITLIGDTKKLEPPPEKIPKQLEFW